MRAEGASAWSGTVCRRREYGERRVGVGRIDVCAACCDDGGEGDVDLGPARWPYPRPFNLVEDDG